MKNTLKRAFALGLVFVMCLSVVGCRSGDDDESSELSYYYEKVTVQKGDGNNSNDGNKTNNNNQQGKEEGKTDPAKDVNLKGYKFTISSPYIATTGKDAIMSQEKDLHNVIAQIEKKYGCDITIIGKGANLISLDNMRTMIMSGSKVADLVELHSAQMLPFAAAGYLTPWNEVGVDANDKYFVKSYTKLATVNGDQYGISFLRPPEGRGCVVFNKGLLNSIGVSSDDLYNTVKAKKWTWEVMRDYAKKIVAKNTSNGVTNVWGVGGWYQKLVRNLWVSNGAKLADLNGKKGVATFRSENMKEALKYVDQLINQDKVYDASNYRDINKWNKYDNGDYEDQFSKGKLLFLFNETYWIDQYFEQKFDYGIVPMPIGPKAKDYLTESGNAKVMCLTSTNAKSKDLDKSIAIMKLLAQGCACGGDLNGKYEGEDWWKYDIKSDYFRNDRDKNFEMYQLILDSAVIDNGLYVTALKDDFYNKVVIEGIYCGNGSIEANVQALGAQYDKAVEKTFTFKK